MGKFIPWSKVSFKSNEKKYLDQAFHTTWISGGKFVEKFENLFCKFTGSKYSVTVNNGTSAIHLVYLALGLKKGDEIIIPSFGYMASANLALQMGLKPIFADVCLDTYCVDVLSIKKKITPRTKLIIVINIYGNVCDLKPIMELVKSRNIIVLEDSAESLGSRLNNKQSGTIADIGTYSFQATKTITTGEGGMVVTNKNKIFRNNLLLYRNHGVKKKRYFHIVPGHNFRLTNLQAAIGFAQLKNFDKIKKNRKLSYKIYYDLLKNKKGIKLQKFNKNVNPIVWTLALTLSKKFFPSRDIVIHKMLKKGIETRNGFYSSNRLNIFKKHHSNDLKNSDFLSKNVICLPLFHGIKKKEIIYIVDNLLSLRKK